MAKTTTTKKQAATQQALGTFFYAIGRRKTASATVRLYVGTNPSEINGNSIIKGDKKLSTYYYNLVNSPLTTTGKDSGLFFTAKVVGGGFNAQFEAIRLGVARALIKFDPSLKKQLRVAGFLTRDSREVERKKVGLRKARKAPQYSKR